MLDADLDPEPLAVEAVLVALVEALERLVALEDVLQRAAPGRVDAERDLVRRHRPVDERERRPAAFCARSFWKMPSDSHQARISSSRAGWSGTVGSGWKTSSAIGKRSVEPSVLTLGRPGSGLPDETERKAELATEVTDATFENEVLQNDEPVLVDFWAEWCGPCHAVAPVLERIAEEKNLKLVKVNIDENQDLALRYGIQSIPNMILFEGGQPKANAVGAMPKGMLERSLGLGE